VVPAAPDRPSRRAAAAPECRPFRPCELLAATAAINGRRFRGARRDTVMVPAMTSVTIAFDADNPGRWAFHCHNGYHQDTGMMTSVEYI